MRPLSELREFRQTQTELKIVGDTGHPLIGYFVVPSCLDRKPLRVIASATNEWDHVSISRKERVPNWYEMCQIKELFFQEHETAMQVHVPRAEWVNNMPHCLHLWRPHALDIPKPPSWMVGDKTKGIIG